MTRDDLMGAWGLKPVPFDVDGLALHLKPMTAGERQRFAVDHKAAGGADLFARAVVFGICDESGERLFSLADLAAVSALDGRAAEKIAEKVLGMNGMAEADGPKA